MKNQAVKIEWVDSCFEYGWNKEADYKVSEVVSVGILVKKNHESITIALNCSDSGNYGDLITIPRKCIKSIKELREG